MLTLKNTQKKKKKEKENSKKEELNFHLLVYLLQRKNLIILDENKFIREKSI